MKKIKDIKYGLFNSLYSSESGRWLVAAALCAIFYMIVYVIFPITFYINDDSNILYTIAGYYTAGIPADHQYLNFFLAAIIRGLYSICPSIPWYGLFHVFVIVLSHIVITKCIFKTCHKSGHTLIVPSIIWFVLAITVFLFPSVRLQFTLTSAIAGAAGIFLILCMGPLDDSKICKAIDTIISSILILLCYSIRKKSGYVCLCFFAVAVLYKTATEWKKIDGGIEKHVRCLASTMVCLLIVVIGVPGLQFGSDAFRNTSEWNEFFTFDNERYKAIDYPHDSFYENPSLYEDMGWNAELYNIGATNWWFFMDERIDDESLGKIAQTGFYKQSYSIDNITSTASETFNSEINPFACISLCIIGMSILSYALFFVINQCKNISHFDVLAFSCSVLGGFLLCLYLCLNKRMPERAFLSISIPLHVILAFFIIRILPNSTNTSVSNIVNKIISGWIVVIFTLSNMGIIYQQIKTQSESAIDRSSYTLAAENFAISNPEKTFVYDISLTFRYLPFVTYTTKTPTNLVFWGGTGWKSPAMNKQMEFNGYSDYIYSDAFFNRDIYYVTKESYLIGDGATILNTLTLPYMQSTYGNIECVLMNVIDPVNQIYVYQFKKVDTSGYSDGWHQKNGYNYYYENGHVKTGTFSVDGTMFYGNETHSFVKVVNEYGITVYQDTYGHVQQ